MAEVHRNDENHHYEATLDGKVVGFVRFRHLPGQVILIHTETDAAYEGQGIGSALARGALDDVRARGEKAVLKCPSSPPTSSGTRSTRTWSRPPTLIARDPC